VIVAYRGRFGVVPICTVLSAHGMPIAPSTYYAIKARGASAAQVADAYAANALLDAWRANRGVYGCASCGT
jgi:putative transposase